MQNSAFFKAPQSKYQKPSGFKVEVEGQSHRTVNYELRTKNYELILKTLRELHQ